MTVTRTSLLGLTLLVLCATALGSKNDDAPASSLIEQARHLSDIRSEGATPFQLRISFRVINENGAATEGVYTELWISKRQWRRETEVGTFRRIEVAVDRKRWLLDNSAVIPEHIGEIPALSEVGELPGKWKSAKDREINGVNVRCFEQKGGLGPSALCFNKATGTIAAEIQIWHESSRTEERVCSYSDYEKYSDRMLAMSYECADNKRRFLEAKITRMALPPSQDSSNFAPPNGAKESVNCLDSVAAPRVLSAPELPPPTQSFTGTIVVLVGTTIGKDGKPHNLRVTSPSIPAFDETAMEQVRRWRFEPGKCGGEPIETEIVVQVSFTHY